MEKKSNYNYGIAFLKCLMCFEVVLCHYWTPSIGGSSKLLKLFEILRNLAVPTFMFLSFYLTKEIFFSNNWCTIKKRIHRLMIPHLFWTITYFLIFKLIYNVRINEFLWQLFTGHSEVLNPSMWYQIDIMIITILVALISKIFKKSNTFVLLFIFSMSLLLQYTSINYNFFIGFRNEIKYSFGRLIEMIPYAVLGILCSYYDFKKIIKNNKVMCFIGFIFLGVIVLALDKYFPERGFNYSGLLKVYLTLIIITIFILFPFNKLKPFVLKLIKIFSQYTLGIYCIHRLTGTFLNELFIKVLGINMNSFIFCIIIYIVSYLVCFIISKIPLKSAYKIVN